MFCYQCQETAKNQGCTIKGVCGKTDEVASLQDLLIYLLKGASIWAVEARKLEISNDEADLFIAEALFSTITNVNFSPESMGGLIKRAFKCRDEIKYAFLEAYKEKYSKDFTEELPESATWCSDGSIDDFVHKAKEVGVLSQQNEDIRSLRGLLIYGLKGIAAYTDHAYILGQKNNDILAFLQEGLAATCNDSLKLLTI